ncbi:MULTISPECIES: outer membrane lipoprotein-sorting protein [Rubritalea]|nr:outer membrane lipoprotein-sorting protein [Rubritalea squalenifaciens]
MIRQAMIALCVCAGAMTSVVKADEAAERILATARYVSTLQHQDLHGHMTKDGKKMPVSLFLRGDDIQFHYKIKGQPNRFHMRLKDDMFDLFEIKNGKTLKFNDNKMAETINGTDLTYEDLSMRFLYWKDAKVEGQERVNGQPCYKLRLINPNKNVGDYQIVYVWVHSKQGALMKVVGYNAAGKPLKQFQVTDIMRVGNEYTLRRMRVESIDAASNKFTGVTYLEFDKPTKVRQAEGKPMR